MRLCEHDVGFGGRYSRDAPPLASAPFRARRAQAIRKAWATHVGGPVEFTNGIGMKLVLIPPGPFPMGSRDSKVAHRWDESPRRSVTITKPFYFTHPGSE